MRNEKGVTLVELLAAISIFTLVIGVAFLLFSSVNTLWNHSVEEYNYRSDVGLMTDTITKELSEAEKLYLEITPTEVELRFKTIEEEFMALVYNNVDDTLTLYESSFEDNINIAFNREIQVLSTDNVLGMMIESYSPRTTIEAPQELPNTSLYYINITFEDPRVAANGGTQIPTELLIKPFKK